jgi:hypothetical protein
VEAELAFFLYTLLFEFKGLDVKSAFKGEVVKCLDAHQLVSELVDPEFSVACKGLPMKILTEKAE